jgi:hypothetical protein
VLLPPPLQPHTATRLVSTHLFLSTSLAPMAWSRMLSAPMLW